MGSVDARLIRERDGLILLFAPPFDRTDQDPGYVRAYPPGIRENGGQYTHAAVWAAWAFAALGQGDRAFALFRMMNPVHHGDSREGAVRYRVEPYVMAGDVYGASPHTGRGGWTWYTGSAAWMYRLGLEAILGIRRVGQALHVDPCIPRDWPSYDVTYRFGSTPYRIHVANPSGVNRGVSTVTLDDRALGGNEIQLVDDGEKHDVSVVLG
jgi:cyclic beta-1,2-glucan synthetase